MSAAMLLGVLAVVGVLGHLLGPTFPLAFWVLVLPALPIAYLDTRVSNGFLYGLLWDGGHALYLTIPGVLLVYAVPALVVWRWASKRKATWSPK